MNPEEYTKEKLWQILVETVHAMVMYPHHKAYIRDVILHEKPDITPQELAARLGIPLGEALVILYELKNEKRGSS
jgi:ribosomal protein S25